MRFPKCSFVLVALLCCSVRANLLRNGDFEEPAAKPGVIPGWTLNRDAAAQQIWVDRAAPLEGKGSLAIRSTVSTTGPTVVSQRVRVRPNSSYALTLWAKRDSIVYGTRFEVALTKGRETVGIQSKNFRGCDWFPITTAFETGRADVAEVRLTTPNKGTWRVTIGRTLWVDNVQLSRVDTRDNLVVRAASAKSLHGCKRGVARDVAGGGLTVSGAGVARFSLDVGPGQGGRYYLWMRARCPGKNAFTIKTPGGRSWVFRSHTPSPDWRWTRPVLPEFLLDQGRFTLDFTAQGQGVEIDRFVLTMAPFWASKGTPELMSAAQAVAARKRAGFTPAHARDRS